MVVTAMWLRANSAALGSEGMDTHDNPRQATSIDDAERQALTTVSAVERRLFGAIVRYAVDQASRPGTPAARVAARVGLIAAVQNVVGRQISQLGATVMWSGIVAEGAFTLAGGQAAVEVPVVATLFTSGGIILFCAMARIARSAKLEKQFQPGGAAPQLLLDPPVVPLRAPRLQTWAPIVFGLEFVAMGGFLMAAQYEAPRITGAFCAAMGIFVLAVAISVSRGRRRRSISEHSVAGRN